MSDYHVMDGEEDARTYRVAFHVPVPNENNSVGTNLQTALSEDSALNKTSAVPWIATPEQTQLNNGALFEVLESYTRPRGNSLAQDQAALDARFTALVAAVGNRIRDEYKFWHFERNVP